MKLYPLPTAQMYTAHMRAIQLNNGIVTGREWGENMAKKFASVVEIIQRLADTLAKIDPNLLDDDDPR